MQSHRTEGIMLWLFFVFFGFCFLNLVGPVSQLAGGQVSRARRASQWSSLVPRGSPSMSQAPFVQGLKPGRPRRARTGCNIPSIAAGLAGSPCSPPCQFLRTDRMGSLSHWSTAGGHQSRGPSSPQSHVHSHIHAGSFLLALCLGPHLSPNTPAHEFVLTVPWLRILSPPFLLTSSIRAPCNLL